MESNWAMKLENLLELYEFEKKRQEVIEEKKRYEKERLLKVALDVGATVVQVINIKKEIGEELRTKAKQDTLSPPSKTLKGKKQASKTGPSFSKKRRTSQTETPSENPTPAVEILLLILI